MPNFGPVDTSAGTIDDWHAELGAGWTILFSHPKDYTPVCTTELGTAASLSSEFAKRGVKMYSISLDPADSHATSPVATSRLYALSVKNPAHLKSASTPSTA